MEASEPGGQRSHLRPRPGERVGPSGGSTSVLWWGLARSPMRTPSKACPQGLRTSLGFPRQHPAPTFNIHIAGDIVTHLALPKPQQLPCVTFCC